MSPVPDPLFALLTCLLLALLFGVSAAHKFGARAEFAGVLGAYELLPAPLVPLAAWLLPALEALVAAALLVPATRHGAAAGAALLFAAYGAAIAINLARGRRDLDCGCAGPGERRPIGAWMVWRNALLAGVALASLLPAPARALGLADLATAIGGALGFSLLYLAIDRLYGRIGQAPGVPS